MSDDRGAAGTSTPPRRCVARGGPVHGLTWWISADWAGARRESDLFTFVHPVRGHARWGGGFCGPAHEPGRPVHTCQGHTDDLPADVLARTEPEVEVVWVYGTSGRRYRLDLTDVDDETGLRFGVVFLAPGDEPARACARLASGRTWTSDIRMPPRRLFSPGAPDEDPAPPASGRDLYLRARAAAGATDALPRGGHLADLAALADAAPECRDRAAEVLCAHLRGPAPGQAGDGDREVRRLAQRLLEVWSRRGPVRLDLTGAHLVDLDLAGCRLEGADFTGVTVEGGTALGGASFADRARFSGAAFRGGIDVAHAGFADGVELAGAAFGAAARFDGATVGGDADLAGATFRAGATFTRTVFGGDAALDGVVVSGDADFALARFGGRAGFAGASVGGHAVLGEVVFAGDVELADVRVRGQVVLDGAVVTATDDRARAWPAGWSVEPVTGSEEWRRVV